MATTRRGALQRHQEAEPGDRMSIEEYLVSRFSLEALPSPLCLPLPDEPFVETWAGYAREARAAGAFSVLRQRLVQLRFPVRAGISATPAYGAATRRGQLPVGEEGLELAHGDRLEIRITPTAAGRIPVLVAHDRADFVALLRALARRNEPDLIPDSLGALMVVGYNNWDRIAAFRRRFESGELRPGNASTWSEAFALLRERKELYQDRFILLSTGPYSGVAASELGLSDPDWRRLSLEIRLQHEATHYLTRRLLGSMRNNLHDELIADYAGMAAARGRFSAEWERLFLGIEAPGRFRPGGRLESYRGKPPLSNADFRILQRLARRACSAMETADRALDARAHSPAGRARMVLALASLTLAELAEDDGAAKIGAAFQALPVSWSEPTPERTAAFLRP